MDEDKHIERQIELWIRCEQLLKPKMGQLPTFEMTTTIYEEVNKWLISDRIQEERRDSRTDKEKKEDEPATEKQLKFIKDLGGTIHDGMTKKEAHKVIEELRS